MSVIPHNLLCVCDVGSGKQGLEVLRIDKDVFDSIAILICRVSSPESF